MIDEYPYPNHPMHSEMLATLASGQKIKRRVLRMRACDEKNAKGKPCLGHLKRWFAADAEITKQFGDEIYRCERCHTLYVPNEREAPRTRVLTW